MSEMIFVILDIITLIVLFFTLRTYILTKRTIDKERFEGTFFKLFEIWLKLLIEITTPQPGLNNNLTQGRNISEFERACSENISFTKLNQFIYLLFQILKYIKDNEIKEKMPYADIIRPFLTQFPQEKILSLSEKYIKKDDFHEYKELFEEYLKS